MPLSCARTPSLALLQLVLLRNSLRSKGKYWPARNFSLVAFYLFEGLEFFGLLFDPECSVLNERGFDSPPIAPT